MTQPPPVAQEDFDELLELLGRPAMTDVIRLYISSVPGRLAQIGEDLGAGNLAGVATVFHTMRSGAGQLGLHPLEALCADGEKRAKGGDVSSAAARAGDVRAEYERCLAWFEAGGWLGA